MDKQFFLNLLEKGVDTWNQWRKNNPGIHPVLEEIQLEQFDLLNVNFSCTTFYKCKLINSHLCKADLRGVCLKHTEIKNSNFVGSNISRFFDNSHNQKSKIEECCIVNSDFSNSNLFYSIITNSSIKNSFFKVSNFDKSEFDNVKIYFSNFDDANFRFSKIKNNTAYYYAIIKNTNFSNAIFENTYFSKNIFNGTEFPNAKFNNVKFIEVNMSDINMNQCGYEKIIFDKSLINNFYCQGSEFIETNFNNSIILGSSFTNSRFRNTVFNKSFLIDTDFKQSLLKKSGFQECEYYNTNFDSSIYSMNDQDQKKIIRNSEYKPLKIFISYAHEDIDSCNELEKHFSNMKRSKEVELWIDRSKIKAGDEWKKKIQKGLEEAQVGILLISQYFFEKDFIIEIEYNFLIESQKRGLLLIPILVRHCDYEKIRIQKTQFINDRLKPLCELNENEKDEIYVKIIKRVRDFIIENKLN